MPRKKTRRWVLSLAVLFGVLLVSNLAVLSDEDTGARALSIVVEQIKPAEGQGFSVELSANKGCGASYILGETLTLSVRSAQAGYLTIYDFSPDGRVTRIFPNYYQQNNKLEADTIFVIPASQAIYNFVVGPPQGMDILKAIVTTTPGIAPAGKADKDNPYPSMSQDQREFARNLNVVVAPQSNWGASTCVYYIGPTLGSVAVNSMPQGAEIYWDGAYYWQTPVTIYGQTAGLHTLLLKKDGYIDWTQLIEVRGGTITPVTVRLEPISVGWQAWPRLPTIRGGVTTIGAIAFNAAGAAAIADWYWLRDPGFQSAFGWRFPIERGFANASEAWINIAALVTNDFNGGQGYETTVQLRLISRDAQGNPLSQGTQQVPLTNTFRPKSPLNSNGEGYGSYGLIPLDPQWLLALPVGGSLEITAMRIATSYDGIYRPHVAFNPDAIVLRYR